MMKDLVWWNSESPFFRMFLLKKRPANTRHSCSNAGLEPIHLRLLRHMLQVAPQTCGSCGVSHLACNVVIRVVMPAWDILGLANWRDPKFQFVGPSGENLIKSVKSQ